MTKYNSLGASTTQINVLAVLEATSPRPGCQHGWALARLSFWLVNDALLTVHTCGRWTKKSITLGPSPFNFNYHLKALSPSTVTMRVRASASEFWGKYNSGHAWPENVTESQSVYTERLEGCSSKSKNQDLQEWMGTWALLACAIGWLDQGSTPATCSSGSSLHTLANLPKYHC